MTGFEPTTSCSQNRCATGLRYTLKVRSIRKKDFPEGTSPSKSFEGACPNHWLHRRALKPFKALRDAIHNPSTASNATVVLQPGVVIEDMDDTQEPLAPRAQWTLATAQPGVSTLALTLILKAFGELLSRG